MPCFVTLTARHSKVIKGINAKSEILKRKRRSKGEEEEGKGRGRERKRKGMKGGKGNWK